MKKNFLAAKIVFILGITAGILQSAHAGIPVIDGTNLTQNIISALEAVSQTIKQIQQYQMQLQQYENQLQNTQPPASYSWDESQSTIHDLTQITNTLAYYQNQLGSLDAYLGKFQDVTYYRGSPCFSSVGCSDTERVAMGENRRLASESQKKANNALFKSLEQQQAHLEADARHLNYLQSAAQEAEGHLAALGYANQLASNQTHQLLQMRSLLIAQQNAVATRMQADADKEAQQQTASEYVRKGRFVPSPERSW